MLFQHVRCSKTDQKNTNTILYLNQLRTRGILLIIQNLYACSHIICQHYSLALDCFLLDGLFPLCYQLLQQLQSGLPLLRCLLAKKLVGHSFKGECPHNLRKKQTQKTFSLKVINIYRFVITKASITDQE